MEVSLFKYLIKHIVFYNKQYIRIGMLLILTKTRFSARMKFNIFLTMQRVNAITYISFEQESTKIIKKKPFNSHNRTYPIRKNPSTKNQSETLSKNSQIPFDNRPHCCKYPQRTNAHFQKTQPSLKQKPPYIVKEQSWTYGESPGYVCYRPATEYTTVGRFGVALPPAKGMAPGLRPHQPRGPHQRCGGRK